MDIVCPDLATLPFILIEQYRDVPPISAVYFCLDSANIPLYIGSSWHLRRRWCNHHKRQRLAADGCTHIAWMACPLPLLDETEMALTAQFLPRYNTRINYHRRPQNTVVLAEYTCAHCGILFYARPSVAKKIKKMCCSRKCANQAKRGSRDTSFVACICSYCHRSFSIPNGTFNAGGGVFCSRICAIHSAVVPLHIRFWTRVKKCVHTPYCLYCCWPWTGVVHRNGYGKLWVACKKRFAHIVIWELHNQCPFETTTQRWMIRHLCNNSLCVNPWHLQRGTSRENHRDRVLAKTSRLIQDQAR